MIIIIIINSFSFNEANSSCLVYISIAHHVLSRAKSGFFFMNFFIISSIAIIIIESTVSGHSLNQSVFQLKRDLH